MAGSADQIDGVAGAAIDRANGSQGYVHPIEDRALFDVNFDKTQIPAGVAFFCGNGVKRGGQAGLLHGLQHGHALGIGLRQPVGVEIAHQGTGAQERGAVALSFLFSEAHDFDGKGQAALLCVQLLHAGHGDQNAQSAIVFATVADGVVVRTG